MRAAGLVLAFALLTGPALAESAQSGVWTYSFEPSPSGKGGIVTALSPSPSPTGDPNDPSYLIARCMGGRTELLVGGSGGWGMPRRQLDVLTQIDGAEPEVSKWGVATNGKAAFLDDKVEAFLGRLPDDGKLRVAVKDGAGETHETIFATTGFGAVRTKIAEACGWGK